jgi:hypothetical protein
VTQEPRQILRRLAIVAGLVCLICGLWPSYTHAVIPASTTPGFIKSPGDLEGYDTDLSLGLPGRPSYHYTDHKRVTLGNVKGADGRVVGQSSSFKLDYSNTFYPTSASSFLAVAGLLLLLLTRFLRPKKVAAA